MISTSEMTVYKFTCMFTLYTVRCEYEHCMARPKISLVTLRALPYSIVYLQNINESSLFDTKKFRSNGIVA